MLTIFQPITPLSIRPSCRRVLWIMILSTLAFAPTVALAKDFSTQTHIPEACFAVADERDLPGGGEDSQDTLVRLIIENGTTQVIGMTGTDGIEAISFGSNLELFAANRTHLGTLDLLSGAFTPRPQPLGTAGGSDGEILLNDIDGIAYSLSSNILFGTLRRRTDLDILVAIDPVSGAHIPDYFGPAGGPKTDYVVIPAVIDENNNSLGDVDDIQFDPVTGALYGAHNQSGASGVLAGIDVSTGTPTLVATFRYTPSGEIIDDIEGISFSNDGFLYASTGDNFSGDPDDLNKLFIIDPATGIGELVGPFPHCP